MLKVCNHHREKIREFVGRDVEELSIPIVEGVECDFCSEKSTSYLGINKADLYLLKEFWELFEEKTS